MRGAAQQSPSAVCGQVPHSLTQPWPGHQGPEEKGKGAALSSILPSLRVRSLELSAWLTICDPEQIT